MNMTQPISLQAFIHNGPGDDDETGPVGLFPEHVASMPQWKAAASRIAETLTETLRTRVDCDVELSVIDHHTLRAEEPEPGLLIPLEPIASGAVVHFPGTSAQILSNLLLFDLLTEQEPAEPDEVDAALAVQIIDVVNANMDEALGLTISRAAGGHGVEWPLTPPPQGQRLLAAFTFTLNEDQHVSLQIVFPSTEEKAMEKIGSASQTVAPELLVLETEAIVARWRARTELINTLEPGAALALPGGNRSKIALETESDGKSQQLAVCALTQVHGRRALTFQA